VLNEKSGLITLLSSWKRHRIKLSFNVNIRAEDFCALYCK